MDRQARILQAAIDLLAREGISGVSMRAVAREAGVALGLVNYHFEDKTSLIRAALHRIEEQDLGDGRGGPALAPENRLRTLCGGSPSPEFLTTEYLSLRLQLWALARVHADFERINTGPRSATARAWPRSSGLPGPSCRAAECGKRAADIDVVQNGIWLTALLGLDRASVRRSVERCEEIALTEFRRTERSSSFY